MSDAQDWTFGQPIERLKEFAEVFKTVHKDFVFGAFGLVKERDVAPALAESRLIWSGEPPRAVAIARALARNSEHIDFTGRPILLRAPCFAISAFAALDPEAGAAVLAAVELRRRTAPVYLEIFEEDRVAKKLVRDAGYQYLGTKVMAGSEIKGLYGRGGAEDATGPGLPAEELATQAVLMPGFLPAPQLKAIRDELSRWQNWAQHYSSYNKRQSWTAFALRGYADDPLFIEKPAEMSKGWKDENPKLLSAPVRWTSIAQAFKTTRAVLDGTMLAFDRVRFMRLRHKDGELTRHADITDRDAGVRDGKITRLHVPIITSDKVTFHGWDARGLERETKFPTGALCYLDQRKPHRVTNEDPGMDRVHLVMDAIGCEPLRKLIRAAGDASTHVQAAQ